MLLCKLKITQNEAGALASQNDMDYANNWWQQVQTASAKKSVFCMVAVICSAEYCSDNLKSCGKFTSKGACIHLQAN